MTPYEIAAVALLLVAAALTWRCADTSCPATGRHHMTPETRARSRIQLRQSRRRKGLCRWSPTEPSP